MALQMLLLFRANHITTMRIAVADNDVQVTVVLKVTHTSGQVGV